MALHRSELEQLTLVESARARGSLLVVQLYCEAPSCPVRELELLIKDYDHTLLDRLHEHGLRCPVCRRHSITVHWARTVAEDDQVRKQEARVSVNLQMRGRDRGDDPRMTTFSPADLLDDRLPPTPPGWFK